MNNIQFAAVLYQENRFGNFNKSDTLPISAIYETTLNDSAYIQPKDKRDFKPNHKYNLRLCVCGNDEYCTDMTTCEDYEYRKGYIVGLSHDKIELEKEMKLQGRVRIPKKTTSTTESEQGKKKRSNNKGRNGDKKTSTRKAQMNEILRNKLKKTLFAEDTNDFQSSEDEPVPKPTLKKQKRECKTMKFSNEKYVQKYSCDYCGKDFVSKSAIIAHLQVHQVQSTCNNVEDDNLNNQQSSAKNCTIGSSHFLQNNFENRQSSAHDCEEHRPLEKDKENTSSILNLNSKNRQSLLQNSPNNSFVNDKDYNLSPNHSRNNHPHGSLQASPFHNRDVNQQKQNSVNTSAQRRLHFDNSTAAPTFSAQRRQKRAQPIRKYKQYKEDKILKALEEYKKLPIQERNLTRGEISNEMIFLGEGAYCSYDRYVFKKRKGPKEFLKFLVHSFWSPETLVYRCQDKRYAKVQLEGGDVKELTPKKKTLLYGIYNEYLRETFKRVDKRSELLLDVSQDIAQFIKNDRRELFH